MGSKLSVDMSDASWQKMRMKALVRDDFTCRAERIGLPPCGCDDFFDLIVHHIVWRIHGGTHTLGNLVTLCNACHEKVHPHLKREKKLNRRARELSGKEL